jgi:hypothetical protein
MCSVTPDTLAWLALAVEPADAPDAPDEDGAPDEDEDEDEQAATVSKPSDAAAATARVNRALPRAPMSVLIMIVVPP